MIAPVAPRLSLSVDGQFVVEASPLRLWRKKNQAATLEILLPRKGTLSWFSPEKLFRQGSIIEMFYGEGAASKRLFYGFLPSTAADRNVSESDGVTYQATDFLGQLNEYQVTLGSSASSYIDPVGYEIGALIGAIAREAVDAQFQSNDFSVDGVWGTDYPQQFVTEDNAIYGTMSAKKAIDAYTELATSERLFYPLPPRPYEYCQVDAELVWRPTPLPFSHAQLANYEGRSYTPSPQPWIGAPCPAATLTIGKDAVISGMVRTAAVYTDAIVEGKETRHAHEDRDSSRRWGGRRFYKQLKTESSFADEAQSDAILEVETTKLERVSFSLELFAFSPFHPGDLLLLFGGQDWGIPVGHYPIAECEMMLHPTKTSVTVDTTMALLTDYLA